MINDKSRAIAKLKVIITDADTSPSRRIQAANELLARFGATKRALPLVKSIIKTFENFQDTSLTNQRAIRTAVEQLESTLALAIKTKEAEDEVADEAELREQVTSEQPIAITSDIPTELPLIGGLKHLPPDGPNDFWDKQIGCRSRRELFLMLLGLDPALSRSEIITAMSDPARIKAHTLELKVWSRTVAQLDEKFQTDEAIVRAALAERGLEDSDAGRDELIRQLRASGRPLVEFQRPTDPDEVALPVLVRTESGLLLDAIDFTKSWPHTRAKHTQL